MAFLPDWASDISVIITIAGFAFTIYQVIKIKSTARNIQSQIQKVLAISDLSKSSETIKIIYNDLSNKNFDMAHYRILEISKIIIEIKENPQLKGSKIVSELEAYARYLSIDLEKLQRHLLIDHTNIDKTTIEAILRNLREISNIFAKINAQLKNQNNE